MKNRLPFALFSLAAICGLPASALADQHIPAKAAINRIAEKHGAKLIDKIVEMKATNGQSQPEEWEVIVFDSSSQYLLREFWVGDTRATDEGVNYDYYPEKQPTGFINLDRIKLGSVAAFKVLDEEAARAQIGFDSIDYHLRCREFSDEPIWTLTAKSAGGYQVGRVDLSADTGEVLRTVWTYRQGRTVSRTRDSALLQKPKPLEIPTDDLAEERRSLMDRARNVDEITPKTRVEPDVPAPIDPTPIEDPGNEVPEIIPLDPELPGADEP